MTHASCELCLLSSCSVNRLCELPRGFGSFPALEVLDLTYNNLTSSSFSANFAYLGECLRALYMGDNDLIEFPPHIGKFTKLEIVSLCGGTFKEDKAESPLMPNNQKRTKGCPNMSMVSLC